MVIHILYTTPNEELPPQSALFLFIPDSYVAGWTLTTIPLPVCEIEE
jgi:hypothetical protein